MFSGNLEWGGWGNAMNRKEMKDALPPGVPGLVDAGVEEIGAQVDRCESDSRFFLRFPNGCVNQVFPRLGMPLGKAPSSVLRVPDEKEFDVLAGCSPDQDSRREDGVLGGSFGVDFARHDGEF